jgi:protein-S-isoprenylcysteine O-methyltransferase Ste14
MMMLRLYLLAGLVAHKAVWEWLKRPGQASSPTEPRQSVPLRLRLVKLAKMGILGAILVQTAWPGYWLPILDSPGTLVAAGVALYTLGLATAVAARLQLGRNWSDIEAAQVLPGQAIIRNGIYRYVRHPIYVGDLLLLAGLELALNSWLVAGVIVLVPVVLSRALREEELLKRSLAGYREYCETSKRFIPFVV